MEKYKEITKARQVLELHEVASLRMDTTIERYDTFYN